MNIYLYNSWNKLKASLWLVPAIMIVGAFLLSFITLKWDHILDTQKVYFHSIWQGDAEGARGLLSAIASSTITITGVVFSITTVALALTSNQYGSKLLPSFIRDLGTQLVLGTFISTSIYALLILRTVTSQDVSHNIPAFIPNISITISIAFAILSLGMLIYFIHHLSIRIQSTHVIVSVAYDLIKMIENSKPTIQTPSLIVSNIPTSNDYKELIFSTKMGYLQAIDYPYLHRLIQKHDCQIEIEVRPGHFIRQEMLLATINKALPNGIQNSLKKAFIIGYERNSTQDIEYAIDQLVTIALRALSANANDSFTVNTCLDHLGAALCLVCKNGLSFPYEEDTFIKFNCNQVNFNGLLDASFNQIRQYSTSNPSVLIHILEILMTILDDSKTLEQRLGLERHALMIDRAKECLFEEKDREDVKDRFSAFNKKLKHYHKRYDLS